MHTPSGSPKTEPSGANIKQRISVMSSLVQRAVRTITAVGQAEVVVNTSLPAGTVGRAVYRDWVQDAAQQPLIEIDAAMLDPITRVWVERIAPHGMVLIRVGPEDCPLRIEPLVGPRTLVERRGPAPVPTVEEHEGLLRLDAVHTDGIDPALAVVRRALLAHCRAGATVSLVGEPGTGRATLAAWAHAAMKASAPLRRLPQDVDHDDAPGWLLIEDPADFGPSARHRLCRALQERAPRPRAPRAAHITSERPKESAFDAILGESAPLVDLLHQAARAARTPLPVLILGEPGVGKELLARAVHEASGRRGPLVMVDVGSMSAELVESELFGHMRGAFTGADRERSGAFRSAHRGTLVLDELGNMPLTAQARLLRVLQQGEVRPVGSDVVVSVDVRVVAATNANLSEMVRTGHFREDLLRRLDAITLRLPPLRDRGQDVLLLAAAFAKEATGHQPSVRWLTQQAAQLLVEHRWPGNARELRHVVVRAVLEARSQPIGPSHLGQLSRQHTRSHPCLITTTRADLHDHGDLPRTLLAQLTAVCLHVPTLRDRGAASIRAHLLHALDGVPIHPDALNMLVGMPWRGHLPELLAAARVLAADRKPVRMRDLRARLPHLLCGDPRPICLLLHPSAAHPTGITGFRRELRANVVLLGGDAEHANIGPPHHTTSVITVPLPGQRTPGVPAGIIERTQRGLTLRRPPRTTVPVRLFRLDGLGDEHQLTQSDIADVGPAAELVIGDPERAVQLFIFFGHDAIDRFGAQALRRVHSQQPGPPPRTRPRVWRLDSTEIAVLNHVVTSFRGGNFAAHLQQALGMPNPMHHRLRRYVLGVRPTQYCGRIYAYPANEPLRHDLAVRIHAAPDPAALLDLLPLAVRRHVHHTERAQ